MTSRTSPCTPPADPGSAAVVAHAAESSGGACTPSTLNQLRRRWLVLFLTLGFLGPLLLWAVKVVLLGLVAYIEASFPEYAGAILGWSIWLCVCLLVVLWCYWEDKLELS